MNNNEKFILSEYNKLLKLIEENYKYLLNADANSSILHNYKLLIRHLKSLKINDIIYIIGDSSTKSSDKQNIDLSDKDIYSFSFDQIKRLIFDKSTTRNTIEIIAIKRFSMSKSEVKGISSKQKLIEQIISIIENAKTHESIERIASK